MSERKKELAALCNCSGALPGSDCKCVQCGRHLELDVATLEMLGAGAVVMLDDDGQPEPMRDENNKPIQQEDIDV